MRVELTGISYCDESYQIPRRNSRLFVFDFVTHVKGTLKIGDQTHHPQVGDVYIITDDSDHEYKVDLRDPWIKIWFNIVGLLPLPLLDTFALRGAHHIPEIDAGYLFLEGYETCCNAASEAEQIVAIALHTTIIQIAAEVRSREEPTNRQSQELRDFLNRCIQKTPSLAEIAETLGRSESQTIRTFNRDWGRAPHQFRIERKLQKAQVLLTGTAKAVKEIAAKLGFNDEYHFSALFKQKVGLSPKHFRKAVEHGGSGS